MTVIVNLFAGPGAGKSTTAALVFARLKQAGINCEVASEFAKDLTWEGRHNTLKCGAYTLGKQVWRIERLLGQVDVIITDSPILLNIVYQGPTEGPEYIDYVEAKFRSWNNLNYFLKRRDYPYNPKGRNQTEAEAKELDQRVQDALIGYRYDVVDGGKHGQGRVSRNASVIVKDVIKRIYSPTSSI